VKIANAAGRKVERRARRFGASVKGSIYLGLRNTQTLRAQSLAVELSRQLDKGSVAARAHIVDNLCHGGVHIYRLLTLHRLQLAKAACEIGIF
jgi:hypothetical protein